MVAEYALATGVKNAKTRNLCTRWTKFKMGVNELEEFIALCKSCGVWTSTGPIVGDDKITKVNNKIYICHHVLRAKTKYSTPRVKIIKTNYRPSGRPRIIYLFSINNITYKLYHI